MLLCDIRLNVQLCFLNSFKYNIVLLNFIMEELQSELI